MPVDVVFEVKRSFFDSDKVIRAVNRAKRKALSKAGAFVRRRAQTSMRRRKKTSPPGEPPSTHSGELRKLLFFAWDQSTETVVVGPVPFPSRAQSVGAPRLLEFGGDVVRATKSGKRVKDHYRGNPFMRPALEAERPKFADQFKNML